MIRQPLRAEGRVPTACSAGRGLRLSPVAAVCAGLLGAPLLAFAQAAPAPAAAASQPAAQKLDTVQVTGFRASLESSISTKRNADAIVESVSAEDIGKLPDVSIADAISRLPGLTAQRVAGRSSVISIRGMAPRFGVTLLNGREIVSTGDNRSVEYDQFPSELINAATVYKTPDAGLSAQGLSGTINMKTLRPLDFAAPQAVVSARVERNSNGSLNPEISATGNRLSASWVTQSADRTWGAAIGFAHLDSPNQEKHYKSWWWANTNDWGSPLPGVPTDSVALQGFELGAASSRQKRDGLMGVLEYKPNADFHSTLDLYYSKFDQTEARRTVMSDMSVWSGASWSNAQTSVVNGDKIVTSGNVNNLTPVALTTLNKRQDNIRAIGWNNELKLADWKLVGDLSWSKAKRDEQNAEVQAGSLSRVSMNNATIVTGDGRSTFSPSFDFANPQTVYLTDPANWGRDGRSQFPKVRDQIKALKLSAGRTFDSWMNSVEAGVDYSERDKDMNRTEVYYNLKNSRAPVLIPSDLLRTPTDLTFAGSNIRMVNFDVPSVLKLYDSVPAATNEAPGRIWAVHEKVTALYGKLGLEFDWGVPVHGTLGLRVVHAKQWSNGLLWNDKTQATDPTSGGTRYTDTLPSLNLAADLTANTILRFGLAKVLARPNMEDMRAGFSGISVSGTDRTWSASGGNARLEPWRADAVDLSLEHYFSKRSYVAAAGLPQEHQELRLLAVHPVRLHRLPQPDDLHAHQQHRPAEHQGQRPGRHGGGHGAERFHRRLAVHAGAGRHRCEPELRQHAQLAARGQQHQQPAGRPVGHRHQLHRLLRARRHLGTHRQPPPLGLRDNGARHLRRERAQHDLGRDHPRRAAGLRVRERHAEGAVADTAGQ